MTTADNQLEINPDRRVITETDVRRIKRLRTVEGLNWKEIEERTGIPYQSAHRKVHGRKKSKALIQREHRMRKLRREIKELRATVRMLQRQLAERKND